MSNALPKVVKVIDEFRVVINRGRSDDVKYGDAFLVYELGDELFDPDTNESLGKLEVVKGRGKTIHVQERLSTVESTESEQVVRRDSLLAFGTQYERRALPFTDAAVGDVAKPLKKAGG